MASITSPQHFRTHKTKSGSTYGLIHIPSPSHSNKPTLLFLHGYPSSSYDWRYQISTFSALGYGILVPDLLGYGDTSAPIEVKAYDYTAIASDVLELCTAFVPQGNIVGIGHDHGAGLLSPLTRLIGTSENFIGYVYVAVGYSADTRALQDINAINTATEQQFGYPLFGYWLLHGADDGAEVITRNAEAYMSIVYPERPELWISDLCPLGKVRAWTESGIARPLPSWLDKEEHAVYLEIMKKKGWTGPLNWYKQLLAGVTADSEDAMNDGKGWSDEEKALRKPVFYIGASKDFVCLEGIHKASTEEWARAGFESTSIEAGHWVYLEKRDEFDEKLKAWLEKMFGGESAARN